MYIGEFRIHKITPEGYYITPFSDELIDTLDRTYYFYDEEQYNNQLKYWCDRVILETTDISLENLMNLIPEYFI